MLDEAQKIKNAVTKTAQAVRQIDAKWRLALTGTPLENHLGELWSLFRGLSRPLGKLGPLSQQIRRSNRAVQGPLAAAGAFATDTAVHPEAHESRSAAGIARADGDCADSRTSPPTKNERYQAARMAAIAGLAIGDEQPGEDRRFQILAALTRLRQLACHPRLVDADWPGGSAKLELFMEIVEELREGNHRALCSASSCSISV